MELGQLLGSSREKVIITSSDYDDAAICTSVQPMQLSAQKSLAVVETKIELDSYADTCV